MNKNKDIYKLSDKEIKNSVSRINKRKTYFPPDYEKLLSQYDNDYEVLRYIDYVRTQEVDNRKIVMIRHDVDHDHLTAQRMAQWEYKRGLRATYCLLHSAWYYGRLEGDRIVHTQDLIDCAKRLHDLGHEICFHNNLVVTALKENIDPGKLLAQELEFFQSIDVPVFGTSSHGDRLCRELKFRNYELFKECKNGRFSGARTISFGASNVELGKISMFPLGLEYEAQEIARDVYHTDSGGNLRIKEQVRGSRQFGRKDSNRGKVVGILTHPIWWNFEGI